MTRLLIPALLLLSAGLASGQAQFTDVTVASGLLGSTNSTVPSQGMHGGAAAGDFNGDGFPDLFVLGLGLRCDRLYINQGDGTFVDEAIAWNVGARHRGAGVSTGDFNNDGRLDIYVTSWGFNGNLTGRHRLYRNDGNRFTNIAASAGVNMTSPNLADGFGSAFGDYDLDGDLDLFVCGWKLLPQPSFGNKLFRNEGNETFSEVTVAAGLDVDSLGGFSPTFVDMDGDRYPELLLVGDFRTSQYYINEGNGQFREATAQANTSQESNGMGSAIGDFNNDGLFDWYVTSVFIAPNSSVDGNKLYYNQGNNRYREAACSVGVDNGFWGWGAVAADFDNDGWLDIAETNGRASTVFNNLPSRLFMNDGTGYGFTEQSGPAGLAGLDYNGLGLVQLDFDLDGDQDLLYTTAHLSELRLMRNDQTTGNHWLRVALDTSATPGLAPNGFGTKVSVRTGTTWTHRVLDMGSGYLCTHEPVLHFGLGAAAVADEIIAYWPNGTQSRMTAVPCDQPVMVRSN